MLSLSRSIGARLLAAGVVLAFTTVITGIVSLDRLSAITTRLNKVVESSAEKVKLAADVQHGLLAVTRAEKSLLLARTPEEADRYISIMTRERDEMRERQEELRKLVDVEGQKRLDAFAAAWDRWRSVSEEVYRLSRDGRRADAFALASSDGQRLADECEAQLTGIIEKNDREMALELADSNESHASTQRLVMAVIILGIAVSGLFAFFVVESVTRRLRVLAREAGQIEERGDLSPSFSALGDDEIGRLAQALERMRLGLRDARARLIEQASLAKLGELAAVVAHEVKNPLAGIGGALRMLKRRLPDGAGDEARIVDKTIERVSELDSTVEDILRYSRPRTPHPVAVQVRPLLEESLRLVSEKPEFSGVKVALLGPDVTARCDTRMLQAVFDNLALNAAEAMEGKGELSVAVRTGDASCPPGFFQVSFRDTGPGIPEAVRPRVFEPFFTTRLKGTGLGLSISRQCVELHRGQIRVCCPPEGGTEFLVTLPLDSDGPLDDSAAAKAG